MVFQIFTTIYKSSTTQTCNLNLLELDLFTVLNNVKANFKCSISYLKHFEIQTAKFVIRQLKFN